MYYLSTLGGRENQLSCSSLGWVVGPKLVVTMSLETIVIVSVSRVGYGPTVIDSKCREHGRSNSVRVYVQGKWMVQQKSCLCVGRMYGPSAVISTCREREWSNSNRVYVQGWCMDHQLSCPCVGSMSGPIVIVSISRVDGCTISRLHVAQVLWICLQQASCCLGVVMGQKQQFPCVGKVVGPTVIVSMCRENWRSKSNRVYEKGGWMEHQWSCPCVGSLGGPTLIVSVYRVD